MKSASSFLGYLLCTSTSSLIHNVLHTITNNKTCKKKKEENETHIHKDKKQLIETDPLRIQVLKLADKDFEVIIINVFKNLEEKMNETSEQMVNFSRAKGTLKKNLMEFLEMKKYYLRWKMY